MTRKRFLANIAAAASALPGLARRADASRGDAPAEKPFVCKLSIDGGQLIQEIAVGEREGFEVVTRSANRRWTVRGTTGRVADDALPVDLSLTCFVSPTVKETRSTRRDLKLDGTRSGNTGAIGGHMLDLSACRRAVGPAAK